MGEIARPSTRFFHRLRLAVEQPVQPVHQRLDFAGVGAGEAIGVAGADRFQIAADPVERPEADPELSHGHEHQQKCENGDIGENVEREGGAGVVDFSAFTATAMRTGRTPSGALSASTRSCTSTSFPSGPAGGIDA